MSQNEEGKFFLTFDSFRDALMDLLRQHFSHVWRSRRRIQFDGTILFPSTAIFFDSGDFYGFELLGARKVYKGLSARERRISDINSIFTAETHPSGKEPIVVFSAKSNGLTGVCFFQGEGIEEAAYDRFPVLRENDAPRVFGRDADGPLIRLGSSLENLVVKDALFVSRGEGHYRCRSMLLGGVIVKEPTPEQFKELGENILMERGGFSLAGLKLVRLDRQDIVVAQELKNLALMTGIRETTIGEFLNSHPEIIRRVFRTERVLSEVTLNWIEHDGSVEEEAIRPDLLVRRPDGFYDIVDLKLALLNKKKLTKAERKRRRFIDGVQEGIAQLTNYEFYFSFPGNAAFALRKYGIAIRDPKMVLIIGNNENFVDREVAEAIRMFGGNRFSIIDYDTLGDLFLLAGEEQK